MIHIPLFTGIVDICSCRSAFLSLSMTYLYNQKPDEDWVTSAFWPIPSSSSCDLMSMQLLRSQQGTYHMSVYDRRLTLRWPSVCLHPYLLPLRYRSFFLPVKCSPALFLWDVGRFCLAGDHKALKEHQDLRNEVHGVRREASNDVEALKVWGGWQVKVLQRVLVS